MSSEKTLAIVLRVIDFSETSCVATLFTRDFGKISGLAKGARRPKSPFDAALDLLAVCRVVFLHKSSETLDLLTEAKLERRFRAATRDLSRLHAGYYAAELMTELTDADDPHPALFDAADALLLGLDGDAQVRRSVLRFEMTALRILGHLPSLDVCVECGERVDSAERAAFGQLVGGVLCERHRGGKRPLVSVRRETLKMLQCFAAPEASWQTVAVAPRVWGESRGLINQYPPHLVGHRLRMQRYLGFLAD
jgi:DNA repair protein RecO (recombination protein O)